MAKTLKQVSIALPPEVYRRAVAEARKKRRRPDGLKLLPSAVIREWVVRGMEASK